MTPLFLGTIRSLTMRFLSGKENISSKYSFQEEIYDCSENTHLHHPGPWNCSAYHPLAAAWTTLGTRATSSLALATWFSPLPTRDGALFLVRGSLHLHWQRHTRAYRCPEVPCQSRSVSLGAQSYVFRGSGYHRRAGYHFSFVTLAWVCAAGVGNSP